MKKPLNKKLNNGGFTVMELVVVLAVMVILMGITLPRLINYVNTGNEIERQKQEELADKAVRQYFAYEGGYPDIQAITGADDTTLFNLENAAYNNLDGRTAEEELRDELLKVTSVRLNIDDYKIEYNEISGTIGISF